MQAVCASDVRARSAPSGGTSDTAVRVVGSWLCGSAGNHPRWTCLLAVSRQDTSNPKLYPTPPASSRRRIMSWLAERLVHLIRKTTCTALVGLARVITSHTTPSAGRRARSRRLLASDGIRFGLAVTWQPRPPRKNAYAVDNSLSLSLARGSASEASCLLSEHAPPLVSKTHGEMNHRPEATLSVGSQTVLPTVRFSSATTLVLLARRRLTVIRTGR
jgi:hypothetical protein